MSYNLLLDTSFNKIDKHWKLTNCYYRDGYLVSNAKVYSIEQEITLPDPTKLYFSMDYIAFDKNIKKIYVGIQCGDVLQSTIKKPKLDRRNKVSVVYPVPCETIKVKFIVEASIEDTKLYIDSPMLVDIHEQRRDFWPRWMLDKVLDYRHGYIYDNLYKESEISIDNEDFVSVHTDTEQAHVGIIAHIVDNDWFGLTFDSVVDNYYLVKVDIEQINCYGDIYLQYGEHISNQQDDNEQIGGVQQLYMTFRADGKNRVRIKLKNEEQLEYLVNLKRVLIVDITNKHFEEKDIPHLAFI